MEVPVSLVGHGPISLPLKHEAPIHAQIRIPFSLLVKDFDPETTQVPQWEVPRSWLANRLFGRRYESPTDAGTKVFLVACPVFHHKVWPKLSTLLFGKKERVMYSHSGSDVEEWERAGASNLFWAFSTGVTDEDVDNVRAVVLKASPCPDGTGGILFTAEEMDEGENAAWKTAWEVRVPPTPSPSDRESDIDIAMERKNSVLYQLKAGLFAFPHDKESSESV